MVDCFDALTSDRPYRSALSTDAAFDILRARRGTMYEPLVVDTFIRVHRDLVEHMASFPAHDALRQITHSVAGRGPAPVPMVVTPEGVSDDILAFVSLARLASGDASMGDVLSLASGLDARAGARLDDRLVRDGRGKRTSRDCAMHPARRRAS